MTFEQYMDRFNEILNATTLTAPYDNEDYFQYAKMNLSRSNRWLKQNPITPATKEVVEAIGTRQHWVVITEPWCGDAAHIVPILYLMSQLNSNIEFEIQLRDSGSEIDQYLTNGSKSIPILIVRNEAGKDLFHWGPRPAVAAAAFEEWKQKNGDFEAMKIALQQVYNADKGIGTQEEVTALLKKYS